MLTLGSVNCDPKTSLYLTANFTTVSAIDPIHYVLQLLGILNSNFNNMRAGTANHVYSAIPQYINIKCQILISQKKIIGSLLKTL